MKIKGLFIFLATIVLNSNVASSLTIHYSDVEDIVRLEKGLEYSQNTHGALQLGDVMSPKFSWILNPRGVLNFENTSDDVWLKFEIKNRTSEKLFLQFGNTELDHIRCFGILGDEVVWKVTSGNQHAYFTRYLNSNKICLPLGSGDITVYVQLNTGSSFYLPLYVGTLKALHEINHKDDLFNGAFLGIMLVILFYNFFLFISVRDRLYLQYCIYLLFSTLLSVLLEGLHFDLLWRGNFTLNNGHIPNLIVGLTTASAIWFSASFLSIKINAPRLKWINLVLILSLIFIIVIDFMNYRALANTLIQTASGVTSIYLFITGIVLLIKGLKAAKFYVLSWGILVLGALVYVLTIRGVVDINFFTLNSFQIGSMLEGVLLSFALADRINTYRLEKNEAQKLAIAEAKEKEELIRNQNIILESEVEKRTHELKSEMRRSDDLLLNILPLEVAQELKEHGASEARLYSNVTVLFTDFANFTGIGETLSPQALVNELDYCFKAFDRITEKYQLEKIKTIGDAYLAVCGLPAEDKDHAKKAIEAALELSTFISDYAQKGGLFEVRIGINSGPVVAGIVGIKKFAYDIWGDTVNTASRMESEGEVGKVNISHATHLLIKDDPEFQFVNRGKILVKGKGEIEMFFVSRMLTP